MFIPTEYDHLLQISFMSMEKLFIKLKDSEKRIVTIKHQSHP